MNDPKDRGERRNQGKARYDLFPWGDVDVVDRPCDVATMYAALKVWLYAAPTRLECSFPRGEVRGVAEVMTFGASKYAPRNWERGLSFAETFASAARHAEALAAGELLDPESGLAHQSHFWCNVMFLLTFTARDRTDLDDRPPACPRVVGRLDRLRQAISSLSGGTPGASTDGRRGGGSN